MRLFYTPGLPRSTSSVLDLSKTCTFFELRPRRFALECWMLDAVVWCIMYGFCVFKIFLIIFTVYCLCFVI